MDTARIRSDLLMIPHVSTLRVTAAITLIDEILAEAEEVAARENAFPPRPEIRAAILSARDRPEFRQLARRPYLGWLARVVADEHPEWTQAAVVAEVYLRPLPAIEVGEQVELRRQMKRVPSGRLTDLPPAA